MLNKKDKKKLIIVGGGFAGISVAKKILKNNQKKFDITLIDKKDYQFFHPAVFRAISSSASPSQIFSVLAIKFENIFKKESVEFLKKEIQEVLPRKIKYDYLVFATGSTLSATKLSLTSFENVLKIKTQLEEVFRTKAKRDKINITVVGAGITGCELISAIASCAQKLAKKYSHPRETIELKLFEERNKILPNHSSWLRNKIKDYLEKVGVKILLKKRFSDEDEESVDILVWTSGVKHPVSRIKASKKVFVIKTSTAQSAIHQGEYTARSIVSLIEKKKIKKYKSIRSKYIIQLGNKYFAHLGFITLEGVLAKFLKEMILLKYFTKIISFKEAKKWLKKYNSL